MEGESEFRIALVSTTAEWCAVHEIRRQSFPSDMGTHYDGSGVSDEFDALPNSFTYLLTFQNQPVGTIRLSVYGHPFGWASIPAVKVFGSEMQSSILRNVPVLQSSLFAISKHHRSLDKTPKLILLREFLRSAFAYQCDYMVTIVRNSKTQLNFYARMGLRKVAGPKLHPWAAQEVVLLRATPYDSLKLVRDSKVIELIGCFNENDKSM
jgi:hypothetical protein